MPERGKLLGQLLENRGKIWPTLFFPSDFNDNFFGYDSDNFKIFFLLLRRKKRHFFCQFFFEGGFVPLHPLRGLPPRPRMLLDWGLSWEQVLAQRYISKKSNIFFFLKVKLFFLKLSESYPKKISSKSDEKFVWPHSDDLKEKSFYP